MKINIQAVGMTTFSPLQDHIDKKVGKLENFFDKIHTCKVFLKKENSSEKENKTTELILGIPGDEVVVKKTSVTFEESIDLCVEAAKKLLLKKKEVS